MYSKAQSPSPDEELIAERKPRNHVDKMLCVCVCVHAFEHAHALSGMERT